MIRSCLQDTVINSAPRIGYYIKTLEFYRQFPPIRVKDTKFSEIENTSCVRNVMRVSPVYGIEREPWGAARIMRKVNDGVYICTCNVKYDEYKCWEKHAFFYSNFKPLYQSKCCRDLIDNRAGAPIYVLRIKIDRKRSI